MKFILVLGMCCVYSASSFVITIPTEDLDNEPIKEDDAFQTNNYISGVEANGPGNDVEFFSPTEVKSIQSSDGYNINDWQIAPPVFEESPMTFDTPSSETGMSFNGDNDGMLFSDVVVVNGIPTELSHERTDAFENIYHTARVYQWLLRFCATHPRCDTETLMELIMSTPEEINQDFESGFYAGPVAPVMKMETFTTETDDDRFPY